MKRVISLNPATGAERELGFNDTSRDEVVAMCARAASAASVVAQRPLNWRAAMLRAMADALEEDREMLVATAMAETALPLARLEGELRRTAYQFRFFANVVLDGSFLQASIDHETDSPMGPLPDLRRMKVPLGPVAVFGSSNFPFAFSVPGGDTASALAAGCPVVIKAHPAHPATSVSTFDALVRAAQQVDAPQDLLGLVFGLEAGEALVEDPAICAVGFTGSVPGGRALWTRANARPTPIPFYGELGSANPLVVTKGAAAERAHEIGTGVAGSMSLGVGQFCTKPGLIFVPDDEHGDQVVKALASSLQELAPMTMLSPGIAEHFRRGGDAIAVTSGTTSLVADDDSNGATVSAHAYEVTSRDFVQPSSAALREECFGPLAVVVRYHDRDDLEMALAIVDPALTFSVFSAQSDDDSSWLVELGQAKAGRIIVNQYPTGVGVSWSMQHGGPWPSTTSPLTTSVGAGGIERWLRPITFQNMTHSLLPEGLQDDNPLGLPRRVDGRLRA